MTENELIVSKKKIELENRINELILLKSATDRELASCKSLLLSITINDADHAVDLIERIDALKLKNKDL